MGTQLVLHVYLIIDQGRRDDNLKIKVGNQLMGFC